VLGKGLQHHPRYTAAWISLGRVQLKLGHYSDAEKSFARALELDPENSVSARLLGDTAAAGGDFVRAIKAYKLARALGDPELDERIEEVEALISAAEDEISVEAEEQTDVFEMDPGRDAPVTEVAPADAFDQEASAGETYEEVPRAVQPDKPAKQRPRTVVFVADEDPFGLGADVSPDVAAGDDVFGIAEDTAPPAVSEEPFGDVFGAVETGPSTGEAEQESAAEVDEPVPLTLETPEAMPVEAEAEMDEVVPAEPEMETPLPTLTLARLALQQGDRAMAESIVRTLLLKDPGNDDARQLLAEISAPEAVAPEEAESPYEVAEAEPVLPDEAAEVVPEAALPFPIEADSEVLEEVADTPTVGAEEPHSDSELIRMKITKLGAWADGLRRVSERAG